MVCVAGVEHFVESVLPLHLYVDFRDQTQVTSLAKQVPLLLDHLKCLKVFILDI